MVQDSKGVLYGTTLDEYGAFFSLSPPASPGGQWTAAVLYQSGGTYGDGTVFRMTAPSAPGGSWTETVLWSFGSPGDGATPAGPIAIDGGGVIHGVTIGGGTFRVGTAFTLAPASGGAWSETIIHSFGGAGDGCNPASIVLDADGTAYGTTSGECGGYGTVFSISPSQSETVIYSFNKTGETVLHSFTGGADGAAPYAGLTRDRAGNLYGTTSGGGASGKGVVFKVDTTGTETVLYNLPSRDRQGAASPKRLSTPRQLFGVAALSSQPRSMRSVSVTRRGENCHAAAFR